VWATLELELELEGWKLEAGTKNKEQRTNKQTPKDA